MKTITISSFKAHLSAELRKVRRGGRVVISDRDTPIAEVIPFRAEQSTAVSVRAPNTVPFVVPQPTVRIDHDPVEYLLEDRNRR
ncbi:MAG: type II toxin-antitoxin system Phd/YefM family antitoxin [Deltaproteobacteria bacterium]|nr:type II toxin-antitoxin system Phd/YefM family antitoxin [Deltaproteobacteria bacterium]